MMAVLSVKKSTLSVSLISLLAQTSKASFSLNNSGPDWDYTEKNLKTSTSEKCIQAYSAQVECTDTLLGVVASMRPAFDPSAGDLDAMCTPGCQDALQQYIDNVKTACSLPNDAAELLTKPTKPYEYGDSPVELVGQMFQYSFAQTCRKADNGTYCYLTHSAFADTDFDCNDACYTSFYQNAYDYASSSYWFNYYELLPQNDYWLDTFKQGYDHLVTCGKAKPESSSLPSSATATITTAPRSESNIWGWATTETGRASLFSDPKTSTASSTAATPSATSNLAAQSHCLATDFAGRTGYAIFAIVSVVLSAL